MPIMRFGKRIRAMFSHERSPVTHAFTEPPKLKSLEFLPHTMDLDGVPGIVSEDNAYFPAIQTSTPVDTPTRQSLLDDIRFSSPPPSEHDGIRSPSALSTRPGSPTNETVPGWSSAVGRASLGKSGRVIEKLMGENDMHRRDKALAKLQRDEEVKQHDSTKSKFEALRVSHDNLQAIHESESTAIARKDRKIEELKAELELERIGRKNAENETKVARRERDEDVGKCRKEALNEQEQRRLAVNSYEVLKTSFKGLDQQYKRQTDKLRSDLKAVENIVSKEQAVNAHITIISDQAEKELARQQKINEELQDHFDAYRLENEALLKKIREQAERNEVSNTEALEEVRKLAGAMRHTINVARDLQDPI